MVTPPFRVKNVDGYTIIPITHMCVDHSLMCTFMMVRRNIAHKPRVLKQLPVDNAMLTLRKLQCY